MLESGQARKHEYVVRGGKIIEGRVGGWAAPLSSDSNVNTGSSSNTLQSPLWKADSSFG